MPSFKPKTNKKINVEKNKIITLDGKHREILDNFNEKHTHDIPNLKEQKKALKNVLNTLVLPKQIEEKLDIEDKLSEISKKIRNIKLEKKQYLLTNSKHIFDYFENKKNITNCEVSTNSLLDKFFKVNSGNKDIKQHKTNDIVCNYLKNVDESFLDINNYINTSNVCNSCDKGELIPIDEDGLLVCNHCAKSIPYLIENEKPSYKEPPKEVCFYAYKRINHFREILAQFQAKETTQIPEKVIEDIKLQIKKERIELKTLTNNKAKEILKKLGYNKYYEHIPFIKDIIGIKPPVMTPELEDTLCNLFMDIQGPYAKFCPDDRVNFLNYYYTVYKLCELLDQNQFLPYFPMLKDREKRIDQDNIWKQICNELEWEFIPTI